MTIAGRAAVLACALMAAGLAHAADVTVSAAASLTNAFKELAPAFEAAHPGTRLLFNFAASDTLLGMRKFWWKSAPARSETAVMATYAAGQLLISKGAAAAAR